MPKGPSVVDKDLGWKEILKAAAQLSVGAYVKVGILSDDERGGLHKTDPVTGQAQDLTVAEIAVVNEFGTEDGLVPARPAHRMTFDQQRETIVRTAAKLLGRVVFDRTLSVDDALNILGLQHATAIKNFITTQSGELKANAPSTARAKVPASSTGAKRQKAIDGARPLIDTGATLAAISWGVVLGTVEKAHKFLTRR